MPYDAFREHVKISVSGRLVDFEPERSDPIIEVDLDLPYPTTDFDRRYWAAASKAAESPFITGPFGFRRVRLDGSVNVLEGEGEGAIIWKPTEQTQRFLETIPNHRCGYTTLMDDGEMDELGWIGDPQYSRILCRLRVRSAHVWNENDPHRRVYLNAECLGGETGRDLFLSERDPQRAGDLDMFFYLDMDDETVPD